MQKLRSGALILAPFNRPFYCPDLRRTRGRMSGLALSALFLVMPAFPAFGGPSGDGSGTDNPALLSGGAAKECAYWWQCQTPDPVQTKSIAPQPIYKSPAPQPANLSSREIECADLPPGAETPYECPVDLETGTPKHAPAPQMRDTPAPIAYNQSTPEEVQRPFAFEPDWNVGLRGGFENGQNGSRFVISVLPSFGMRRSSSRGDVTFTGNSEIALEQGGGVRIASGSLSVDANHALGRNTNLTGGASLTASQESAFAPGAAAGISSQPIIVTGIGNGAISHQFGRFGLEARGEIERQVYGATHMSSGAVVDNTSLSRYAFGGGLRASYGMSRTTRMFVDGAIERNVYDAISPSAGVKLDSWTFGLRGGLSLNLGRVVQAEFAGGYGIRQFDAAGLAATPAWLASAEISVRPEERLSFTGSISTEFAVPDSGTFTSEIDYVAGLAAQYRVNNQLGLRASLGGEWRDVIGGPDAWQVTAGAGADFAINKQTAITADYGFTAGQTGAAPIEQSHQISLGVRYGRTSLSVSNP